MQADASTSHAHATLQQRLSSVTTFQQHCAHSALNITKAQCAKFALRRDALLQFIASSLELAMTMPTGKLTLEQLVKQTAWKGKDEAWVALASKAHPIKDQNVILVFVCLGSLLVAGACFVQVP